MKVKEDIFEEEPTIENRSVLQIAQADLIKSLSLEEKYWRQKANITWFVERDKNSSLFHNLVNRNRKKLHLKRINDGNRSWLEIQELMANTDIDLF